MVLGSRRLIRQRDVTPLLSLVRVNLHHLGVEVEILQRQVGRPFPAQPGIRENCQDGNIAGAEVGVGVVETKETIPDVICDEVEAGLRRLWRLEVGQSVAVRPALLAHPAAEGFDGPELRRDRVLSGSFLAKMDTEEVD